MPSYSVKAEDFTSRKAKKRRWEMILAFAAFILIILFSWIELKFFGVNSYLFLIIFNLNLILLLVILFLVFRNSVKLILERKRNVKGARLRSRLVVAFISLSLIPTSLMFIVAVKFVQTSVDYWFRSKVDSSMEQALEVGKSFYSMTQSELENQGSYMIESIRERRFLWGGDGMEEYLEDKYKEYDLSLLGVLGTNLQEQNWKASSEWEQSWIKVKKKVDWVGLKDSPKFWSSLLSGSENDLVIGILPVDKGKTGFLVLGKTIENGMLTKLEEIVQGVHEYKQLKVLKKPLKMAFYLILGVMTLLIIFGSMWFGFRLAKEISAPIQALSLGTQRIAHGDLGVRLEDNSADELGLLVQSFNSMAEDLEKSQERLNRANEDLASRNIELEERRKYMEAVLNNITSGVISLDQEDRISTVNKAAEKILSTDSENLKGRNPLDLLSNGYVEMFRNALSRLKEVPSSQWQRQLDISLESGVRKLLINAVGLGESQGKELGMVIVFEDITELDKMQRMAAWREVAKRIAHEIKNPLTPIKLSAQRLERKYGDEHKDQTFSECTELIVRQVEHLQQMVKEFSSFAKLPEVNPELNSLQPLLQEVVSLFENSHTQISWELEITSELPEFRFDLTAIKRVLINLLTNAAEALKEEEKPSVQVRAFFYRETGWLGLQIIDNGPGFTQEERSRMFEPYFSRKKGNTGLGLTIVKSIISDHHGYIDIKPNHPKGTAFNIELPV